MSTVVISIGATDVTAHIVFQSCHFESQVNGVAGEAKFRYRDDTGTYSASVGAPVVLSVDGTVIWRGFLTQWTRTYVFPALNVTDFGPARFFDATASDINVLFSKRFVFNQSTPANVLAPLLAPHTADNSAIATLVAGWLDLSGDGLDTSTLVENVGDTTWTQEGRAWEGSDSWGQAMQSIANLPAAIYYIDPDKNLVYTDVDTPNAPFGLSDQPNGSTTKGYSQMEVLMDGTGLANDAMCWGVGYGSQVPVFDRDIDATSVTDHGLWQFGQTTFGVYKQATIERIVDSILLGSPDSKRGAKDDRVAVQCVTYEPGLRPAQKVPFTSNVFGFSDVIPIRKMSIDFDGPHTPKYSLTLSHEIDTPFSFFDPFMFDFRFPKFRPLPPFGGPFPLPSDCGITDTFDRPDGPPGTSTAGIPWGIDFGPTAAIVSNRFTNGTDSFGNPYLPFASVLSPAKVSLQFELTGLAIPILNFGIGNGNVWLQPGSGENGPNIVTASCSGNASDSPASFTFAANTLYNFRMEYSGPNIKVRIWDASMPEPGAWLIDFTDGSAAPYDGSNFYIANVGDSRSDLIYIDNLDIKGVNRCGPFSCDGPTDSFNRFVMPGGWGTSDYGPGWVASDNPTVSFVNGSEGAIQPAGAWPTPSGSATDYLVLPLPVYPIHFKYKVKLVGPSPGGLLLRVGQTPGIVTPQGYFFITLDVTPGGSPNPMRLTTQIHGDGGITVGAFSYPLGVIDPTDQWMWVESILTAGDISIRVWLDGGSPGGYTVYTLTGGDTVSHPTTFVYEAVTEFTAITPGPGIADWRIDVLDVTGLNSCRPLVSGGGIPANAWACEQFDVATSTITLQHAFIENSPQVWVNGLLQSPSSYTQYATAGAIVLDFVPGPTANARVCYWALP